MSPATIMVAHFLVLPLLLVSHVLGECTCDNDDVSHDSYDVTLRYKVAGIIAILLAGAAGVFLPILGKNIPVLRPGGDLFYLVKAFAAGVILSTGFVHILPDAFEDLTSSCINEHPWRRFPFTGLAAMIGSLGTLMIDAFATGYFSRARLGNNAANGPHYQVGAEEENIMSVDHEEYVPLRSHASHHGHGYGYGYEHENVEGVSEIDRVRYRVASQVLEVGIIVHSVIIGISLGTSQSLSTIKPLMAALCFHQCFEGMGLGGCIAQADFNMASTWCMALFFSLTTPVGVAVGIGVMNTYDDNSSAALIIQGLLNSCAAGILIYMALVDLLGQDFMSPKLQGNKKLFLASNLALLLGAGFMSVLAIWA